MSRQEDMENAFQQAKPRQPAAQQVHTHAEVQHARVQGRAQQAQEHVHSQPQAPVRMAWAGRACVGGASAAKPESQAQPTQSAGSGSCGLKSR